MGNEHGSISLRMLLGIATLLIGVMLLIVHHSVVQGRAAESTEVKSPVVATNPVPAMVDTVALDATRRAWIAHDLARAAPLFEQWTSAADLARSTSVAQLQPRIVELQDIRRRYVAVQLSAACAVQLQRARVDAMDAHITYFIALKEHWPTAPKRLEQAEQASRAASAASTACRT
ncbi:hypothetical protein ACFPPA_11360 [Rhodanobacter ginsengisoli]|uniref:Uncharacterized protein n=1 Tax=Rhodanobacter ginsengisoli TaxID=418646 RepID=A0ABW0QPN9_9GAMM